MGTLSFNTTAPAFGGVHFNYHHECAVVLSFLEQRPGFGRDEILNIVDSQAVVFEKILHQALQLYSEMGADPVNVGWFQFSTTPSFLEFAGRIRHFINELRIGESGLPSVFASRLLLPRLQSIDAHAFVERFLLPGLGTMARRTCVFVVDLSQIRSIDPLQLSQMLRLLRRLAEANTVASARVVVVTREPLSASGSLRVLAVKPASDEVISLFDHLRGPEPRDLDGMALDDEEFSTSATGILLPLCYLNTGAEQVVTDYLRARHPVFKSQEDDPLWPLLRAGLVKRLVSNGASLTLNAVELAAEIDGHADSRLSANGSKILSFQSLEQLLPIEGVEPSLRRLEASSEFLVDAFALLLGSIQQNRPSDGNIVLDHAFKLAHLENHIRGLALARQKILVSYFGQLLLIRDDLSEPKLFRALEALTQCYSASLTGTPHPLPEHCHEAARSAYALYYLMDRVGSRRPRLFGFNGERDLAKLRKETAQRSVDYQLQLRADDPVDALREQLHLSWYLHDAGKVDAAVSTLLDASEAANSMAQQSISGLRDAISPLEILRDEAAAFAVAMEPDILFSADIHRTIERILNRYGGAKSVADLHAVQTGVQGAKLRLNLGESGPPETAICVHFCRFDWFSALYIADRIAFSLGWMPVLCPCEVAHDDFQNVLPAPARGHVVIGSPDTPGKLGNFVASIDEDLAGLYHARLGSDFALPLPAEIDGSAALVLMASGLGTIAEGWSIAVSEPSRFPFLKRREGMLPMPADLGTTVLVEVLKTVGTTVADGLTKALGRKISAIIRKADPEKSTDPVEPALLRVKQAAVALEASSGSSKALVEAVSALGPIERRGLIEHSDAKGVLVLEDARLKGISEAGADIEPQDFADTLKVLSVVCDALLKSETRELKRREIEAVLVQLRASQREVHDLQVRMRVGEQADAEVARLENRVRRIFGVLRDFTAS